MGRSEVGEMEGRRAKGDKSGECLSGGKADETRQDKIGLDG
jgi:hypothetical protein